jgi:hypothetical protein
MARTLAERQRVHEERKARIAAADAKFAAEERKLRNRRLFEAGGLVEKAKLSGLPSNALYGALLSLKDAAEDPEQVERWATLGGRAFDREAKQREAGQEAIVITFPQLVPKPVAAALRAAGFRFNRILRHWEGLASHDIAERIAKENGGAAQRVAPSTQGAQPGASANGADGVAA